MICDFPRALVALDLSEMDEHILSYFAVIHPIWGIEKAYFLHVMPDFSAPKSMDVAFQKLFAPEYPVDERVRDRLAAAVQAHLGETMHIALSVEVVEGKPYEKLVHWTKVKEIDLLVVGQKPISEGSGIAARRVARHASCHLLFVPAQAATCIQHIVVPVDFSENAVRALQTALALRQRLPEAQITALHIIENPPYTYYGARETDAGFVGMLKEAAANAFQLMLQRHEIEASSIETVSEINYSGSIGTHLKEYVDTKPVDLVIIGAQGHTTFHNLIFGSVTERLVDACKTKPILVIR